MKNMSERRCYYCGHPLPNIRMGVQLRPKWAHIFDVVMQAGDNGITTDDLTDIVGCSKDSLKTHVCEMNELIADSGYRIKHYPSFGYRLIRLRAGKGV
jgi:hypothetical protein